MSRNTSTVSATKARMRPVAMVYLNGRVEYFPSIKRASEATGLYASAICRCCRGGLYMTGGFRFYYLDSRNEKDKSHDPFQRL